VLPSASSRPEVDEWVVGYVLYVFPEKHELDQISGIHKVLGTPSRDLIQQFKRKPRC
jgi:hypothetical protein